MVACFGSMRRQGAYVVIDSGYRVANGPAVLAEHEGYLDGMGFDAEGCLWLAHWGAGCVSRYSDRGELLRRVVLPTRHISNLCFGGAGFDRLYVTSARAGLTAQQMQDQPLAGALFELDAMGVVGLAGLPARG